jgi:hypothetical protein
MKMRINMKHAALTILLGASLVAATAGTAQAGRGGSPFAIRNAIAANSVDAIQAEFERAEFLVCAACTPLVTPLVDHLDYRVRKVAAWWLVRRATARTVYVAMLNRLAQPDSVKARNAADVLGEFGYPSAIPALGAALSNPIFSGEARAAMARALGQIARPEGPTSPARSSRPCRPIRRRWSASGRRGRWARSAPRRRWPAPLCSRQPTTTRAPSCARSPRRRSPS